MTFQEQPIARYLSRKVMEDIRNSIALEPALCAALPRQPLMDSLRALTDDSDAPTLLKLAASKDDDVGRLGLSLLKRYYSDPDVRRWVREQWKNADVSPARRISLLLRLLDDPELEVSQHEEALQFVLSNWQV